MKKIKKSSIVLIIVAVSVLAVAVLLAIFGTGPAKDKEGHTLIGIDDPRYDPKKDPNNPFNDDYRDSEGNYFYENRDMGFNISLPPEFIYFQTQRSGNNSFSDLEIFVPTSDPNFTFAVPPSYARPILVRIWRSLDEWQQENQDDYVVFGEKDGRVYTLKFWDEPTIDWQDKWSDEMKVKLGQSVKML
jgi:hypothetical protein